MIIIGIDPGTAITGFSIIKKDQSQVQLLEYGCIRTSSTLDMNVRLQQIAEDIDQLLKEWQPAHAAIEKIFFQKNVKTAISVAQARGVIIQRLTNSGVSISEYTPLEIKSSICGYGKADKKMVQEMVRLTLGLSEVPKPDDAADAIATAMCLLNSLALSEKIRQ